VINETNQGVAAGIGSTPTLIINGVTYVGAPNNFTDFATVLDQAYAEAP
jgi:protein-disulfide isomerase